MKINRESLLQAMKRRILLPEQDYETIADAVEEHLLTFSDKIKQDDDFPDKVHGATDEAVQRGYKNANSEWKRTALEIVYDMCIGRHQFTVNDFRDELKRRGVKTHDNRAMGGVMRTAQARKWIESTGNTIQSKVGHKSPLQIWRSLLIKPL